MVAPRPHEGSKEMATNPTFHGKRKLRRLAQIEHQSRLDQTFFEFVKSLVYLIEFSRFANDARSTVRVGFERLSEVDSGSHKRAHDLDAAEYGFKDRQRHHVVLGQRDQDECSVFTQTRECLLEGARGRCQHDRHVGAAEFLDLVNGIYNRGVKDVFSAEGFRVVKLVIGNVHRGNAGSRARRVTIPTPS
jgi:hypothetical protein